MSPAYICEGAMTQRRVDPTSELCSVGHSGTDRHYHKRSLIDSVFDQCCFFGSRIFPQTGFSRGFTLSLISPGGEIIERWTMGGGGGVGRGGPRLGFKLPKNCPS
jgi:hypothetical protein